MEPDAVKRASIAAMVSVCHLSPGSLRACGCSSHGSLLSQLKEANTSHYFAQLDDAHDYAVVKVRSTDNCFDNGLLCAGRSTNQTPILLTFEDLVAIETSETIKVLKHGARSGCTVGEMTTKLVHTTRNARYDQALLVTTQERCAPFSLPGDSGSVIIYVAPDNSLHPVGLLRAGHPCKKGSGEDAVWSDVTIAMSLSTAFTHFVSQAKTAGKTIGRVECRFPPISPTSQGLYHLGEAANPSMTHSPNSHCKFIEERDYRFPECQAP